MGRVGVSVPILAILAIAAATGCGEPVVSPSPTLHASTTAAAQETIEATASATPGTTSVEQQPMSVINGTALAVTMFVNGTMMATLPAQTDRKFDPAGFAELYAIMSAQRNTRLLGTFARLNRRDGKPQYLRHQPRIWTYLRRSLSHPALAAFREWYGANVPPPVA